MLVMNFIMCIRQTPDDLGSYDEQGAFTITRDTVGFTRSPLVDGSQQAERTRARTLTPTPAFKPHESIMLRTLDIFSMIVIVRRRL